MRAVVDDDDLELLVVARRNAFTLWTISVSSLYAGATTLTLGWCPSSPGRVRVGS
jgi:hypothetical protein